MSGAWAWISRVGLQAGELRHRDVEDADVGPRRRARARPPRRRRPASPTTSMSAWRSSSRRSPPRTTPWSSAIRISLSRRHPRVRRSSTPVPAPGEELTRSGRRPGARARACPTGRGRRGGARGDEAAAVVGDAHDVPSPCSRRRSTRTLRGARVARDVGQALLHDPVDDDLLVLGRGRRARRSRAGRVRRRPAAAKRSTWVRSAASRPWSSSAAGRSSRARRSSSSIACVATACVSRSSACSSGGACCDVASQAQQDAGQRLVGLVVQVAGDARALGLLGAAARRWRCGRARPPGGRASVEGLRAAGRPPDVGASGTRRAGPALARSTRSISSISRSSGGEAPPQHDGR